MHLASDTGRVPADAAATPSDSQDAAEIATRLAPARSPR